MGIQASSTMSMPPDVRRLHEAVMRNDTATIEELIEQEVDINYPWINPHHPSIKDGTTPLSEAVSLNHRSVVELLIAAGADVDKADSTTSHTPLYKAVYHGRKSITEMLLQAGAKINWRDGENNTLLHVCARNAEIHNSPDTVRLLIKAGASVNARNYLGRTPLHYSTRSGLQEVTDILIKAHAEIDLVDRECKSPLYVSVKPEKDIAPEDLGSEFVYTPSDGSPEETRGFYEHLPAIKVLVTSGCDPLNLATWMHNQSIYSKYLMHDDFFGWFEQSFPERLKQLCRSAIQQRLGFNFKDTTKICLLPLPQPLKDYLCRRLLGKTPRLKNVTLIYRGHGSSCNGSAANCSRCRSELCNPQYNALRTKYSTSSA